MRRLYVLAILIAFSSLNVAQETAVPEETVAESHGFADPQFGRRRNQSSPDDRQLERERLKAMNKDRQRELKEDTDKLLELATELKQYVDKTNENILSVDVIKKADEIEKLAKSVREKMKTYYQPVDEGTLPRMH